MLLWWLWRVARWCRARLSDTMTDGGFSFYLQLLVKATPRLKVGFEAGQITIYEAEYRQLIISSPNFYFNNKYIASAIPTNAVIRYELGNSKRFVPYMQVTAGAAELLVESRTNWGTSSASESFTDYSLGVGAAIKTGTFFDLEPSLRYHVITSDGDNIEMVNLGIGIAF